MFEPGRVLGGKYRVERVLGRGGMGVVLAATHVHLGTPVALKFVHEKGLENQKLLERFLREARAAATLKSEHVCRVFDVGVLDGVPCLVMEQLDGVDLGKVLRKQGRFSTDEAIDYLLQACAGVGEAHAARIVHRDLKPGNLFLTARSDGTPLVKVLDFGVAKALETDTELTQSDAILGSPSYMSLEQLRSSKLVDARSDIWSLGVILYEMLAGRRPFVGEGVADLALKIAMDPVPPMPVPHPVEPIIRRCLERDPNHRFQDVAELAAALAPFGNDRARALTMSIARVVRGGRAVTGPMTGPMTTPMPIAHATTPMSISDSVRSPPSSADFAGPAVVTPLSQSRPPHEVTYAPGLSGPYGLPAVSPAEPTRYSDGAPEPTTMRSANGEREPTREHKRSKVIALSFLGVVLVGAVAIGVLAGGDESAAPARQPETALPAANDPPPPPPPVAIDAGLASVPDAAVVEPVAPDPAGSGSDTVATPTIEKRPSIKKPPVKKPDKPPIKKPPKDVGESRI